MSSRTVLLAAMPLVLIAQAATAQPLDSPTGSGPGFGPPAGAGAPPAGGPPAGGGPPPVPSDPNLPVYGPGGGRVLTGYEGEAMVLRNLNPPLPADAPKPAADPKNLEGAWAKDQPAIARIEWDTYGNRVPFTDRGRAVRERRVKSTYVDQKPYSNASGECIPPGQPWMFGMYYPFHIYQSDKEVDIVFEYEHAVWSIPLNAKHRDASAPRSYMGDSIGWWDGNTLVVETTNYKRKLWLDFDGTPISNDATVTYRIRRIDHGMPQLEIETTVRDPKNYTHPWAFVRTFAWRPDRNVLSEYNCELQVSGEGSAKDYGLYVEPDDE